MKNRREPSVSLPLSFSTDNATSSLIYIARRKVHRRRLAVLVHVQDITLHCFDTVIHVNSWVNVIFKNQNDATALMPIWRSNSTVRIEFITNATLMKTCPKKTDGETFSKYLSSFSISSLKLTATKLRPNKGMLFFHAFRLATLCEGPLSYTHQLVESA